MKKSRDCGEIVRLNSAAFVLPSNAGGNDSDDWMETLLSRVLGGDSESTASCTEFTCNLYAPAPGPKL